MFYLGLGLCWVLAVRLIQLFSRAKLGAVVDASTIMEVEVAMCNGNAEKVLHSSVSLVNSVLMVNAGELSINSPCRQLCLVSLDWQCFLCFTAFLFLPSAGSFL